MKFGVREICDVVLRAKTAQKSFIKMNQFVILTH